MTVRVFAPAKINLTLHVTGQRTDGYHLLDSLVVFADVGDWIRAEAAGVSSLTVTGPNAGGVPDGAGNLVLKAANLFPAGHGAALTLEKNLPAASGIGGGSADAAATLRALARLWRVELPDPAFVLGLGADVPVCLQDGPVRMSGIGDGISPVAGLPSVWMVLVNPRKELATPDVFRSLKVKTNMPMPAQLPEFFDAVELAGWLHEMRNDLQIPAIAIAPVIAQVLTAISGSGDCLLARMSGSGATCFGLFDSEQRAKSAAARIVREYPDWWVAPAGLLQKVS